MLVPGPICLLHRRYEPAALLARHPPVLRHPHKQLAFALACPPGAAHAGPIELSRWSAIALPTEVVLHPTEVRVERGYYDYADGGESVAVWHVNFADPQLFVAYGSSLLAQDELQAVEHPLLGSLREALLAEGQPALTEEADAPTPVLVAGVERRCALATAPDLAAGRPRGLYGHRFAAADAEMVRAALRLLDPAPRSSLIAIAAATGGRGRYRERELVRILTTACTGFAAAIAETRRLWPGAVVEIRTGFWGCGAFGGNRHAMTLLQLLAARLVGIDRLRFYASDDRGLDDFATGAADLAAVLAARPSTEPMFELIERIADLGYCWGESDGT